MINQRGYKFYVVVGDKIESGWEYKEDAQDQKKELRDPKAGRILTKSSLRARGIDPDNDASWMTSVREGASMNASRKRTMRGSGRARGSSARRLDSFTQAYFEAALWSTTDESDEQGGEPLDANYSISDFDADTRARMIADCADFQERFGELISSEPENARIAEYGADSLAGHDFWLTRNGHGAGFWDGGWPVNGNALSEAAKSYGEVWLTVNDDGQIDGHESSRRHSSGFSERRGVVRARGRQVADFSSFEDLLRHAEGEGATHVLVLKNRRSLYYPNGDRLNPYDEGLTWFENGYWHAEAADKRVAMAHPPGGAVKINDYLSNVRGRRVQAGGVVKDYIAVDHRDRIVGGPSKDKEAMKRAAGGGGVVKFVPSSRRTNEPAVSGDRIKAALAVIHHNGRKPDAVRDAILNVGLNDAEIDILLNAINVKRSELGPLISQIPSKRGIVRNPKARRSASSAAR